jgi:iron complex transport system substrate-binding protein
MGGDLKICSLLPSSTEILYSLGLHDAVVAVTHECDYPPEAMSKPQVTESLLDHQRLTSSEIDHHISTNIGRHGSIYHLKEDLLEQLKPDLIITQELCDVCAVSYKDVQRAARVLDGTTRVVSLEPNTLDEVLDTILLVGELTNRREAALKNTEELRERLARVRRLVAGARRPRVYAMEWLSPPFSGGHWVPEMVEIAGGEEVLGKAGQKSERITPEQVVQAQPEVVVLMPCGFSLQRTVQEYHRSEPFDGWKELPAVRNRQVYAVDGSSYFNRSGPRLVDGVEILAAIFHPDRCGNLLNRGADVAYQHIEELPGV